MPKPSPLRTLTAIRSHAACDSDFDSLLTALNNEESSLRALRHLPANVSFNGLGHSTPTRPPMIPNTNPIMNPPPIGMLSIEQRITK